MNISAKNQGLLAGGYAMWGDEDPFENLIGPFFLKDNADGTHKSAFWSEARHCNMGGFLHGGLLMSFADYSLFAIARDDLGGNSVTVGFNSEFIGAIGEGHLIESSGEVLRATRALIFVRGTIFSGEQTLMSFSGVLKRIKAK